MGCKNCGKKYHYCSSCDEETCCWMGYCSDECWHTSEEYQTEKNNFINFFCGLTNEQQTYIKYLMTELDSSYNSDIEYKWISIAEAQKSILEE